MSALSAIHVGKGRLGLDDGTYRDLLERVTGKRSAALLTPSECVAVLDEMRRLGFDPADRPARPGRAGRSRLAGPYAAKVQALWIAGWNLAVVEDRDDAALVSFIARQTGLEAASWLRSADDLRKVVEALKAWLAREADVDWSAVPRDALAHEALPQYRIALAIWRQLIACRAVVPFAPHLDPADRSNLQTYGYRVTGKGGFHFYDRADWIALQNALGRKLRSAKLRRRNVA